MLSAIQGKSAVLFNIDDSFYRHDYESDEEMTVSEPIHKEVHKQERPLISHKEIIVNDQIAYRHETEYYPNGNIKTYRIVDMKTEMATGPFKEYYPDGTIYRKGYLDNDLFQNSVKTYYPSGAIALYQEFDDGYLNGDSILFYESGAIASKIKFRLLMATCDNKYKDYISLIDGDYYEYFEDSKLKTHIKYNKGVIDAIVHYTDTSYIFPSTKYAIVN
jgi:antitoxin component YwqK of YwqJK toxin-antitoxin module